MAGAGAAYQHIVWEKVAADTPFEGLERRMLVGDSLMVCHLRFAPGVVTAVHTHPHEQMTLVQRGRVRFYIGDEERVAGPGEALHFPPNVRHGATMLDEEVELVDIFTPVREDFLAQRT